ncbi:MAG: DUF1761 domain-containing protein [Chlorobi bacterium]|nr:DUF1761 domain-containing protein [Chlorobiota bacterium]MCI0715630.1 DUF1761 domain-containing protein [Chlorobiota bacterium]
MKPSVKFALSVLAYLIPTMILGMVWHFIFFKELYESFGIYNRMDPIVPLGMTSMLIQGIIISYLYPFYSRENNTVMQGIKFGLIVGLFLYSVSTIANAAKINVAPMPTWFLIQLLFHLIQFVVAGALIGWIHAKK